MPSYPFKLKKLGGRQVYIPMLTVYVRAVQGGKSLPHVMFLATHTDRTALHPEMMGGLTLESVEKKSKVHTLLNSYEAQLARCSLVFPEGAGCKRHTDITAAIMPTSEKNLNAYAAAVRRKMTGEEPYSVLALRDVLRIYDVSIQDDDGCPVLEFTPR
jgi:hypothetical protein